MTFFYSRNPEKTLVEVKEHLFERLNILRQCLGPSDEYGDDVQNQMRNEISFLEDMLDMMERS
jgi:hypothetical protein